MGVLIVMVAGAGVLAAAGVAGLGTFAHDLWTREPVGFADVKLVGVSVGLLACAAMIVRRCSRHLPVRMAVVVLGGIAGGAKIAASMATESTEHRQSMATSECRQLLGEDAPAEQVATCIPIALACDREDRRQEYERQHILWIGVNPCIRNGVARAGAPSPC
jgi:hypothetical protein